MRSFCLLLLSILFIQTASAGILIEPQLGYIVSGKGDYTDSGVKVSGKYNGVQYGARLGYQVLGLMGGLSYQAATYTTSLTCALCTPTSAKVDYKQDAFGVFVGYNAPILIRAWIGYNFSVKETSSTSNTYVTNGDWSKGHSTELGVGFTGLPFLSVNVIYRMLSYTKVYDNNTKTTSSVSGNSPKEIALAVSAPFNLF